MERHCAWIMRDPDYIDYHDQHWGRPEYDDRAVCHALSRRAKRGYPADYLKRIPAYHVAFADFDPVKLIEFDEWHVESLIKIPLSVIV